jgi:hypothetical protein
VSGGRGFVAVCLVNAAAACHTWTTVGCWDGTGIVECTFCWMQIVNCCIVSCRICVTGSARGTQLRSTQHQEQVYSYCVTEQSSPSFFMLCGFTSRQCSSQPESCSHPRLPAGAALPCSWGFVVWGLEHHGTGAKWGSVRYAEWASVFI